MYRFAPTCTALYKQMSTAPAYLDATIYPSKSLTMYFTRLFIMTLIFFAGITDTFAKPAGADSIAFTDPAWKFQAKEAQIVSYKGREALRLENGQAFLEDSDFLNGVIEYDVYMEGQRGFPGVIFRIQDSANYEEFYVRPHQSGNPDACQYTPVFNDNPAWQLYHGEEFGKAYTYPVNSWMHVKIIVSGTQAEVYLDGETEPFFVIPRLLHRQQPGGIGLSSAITASHFSNFNYRSNSRQQLSHPVAWAPKALGDNLVEEWSISAAFPAGRLDSITSLQEKDVPQSGWEPLEIEPGGFINISSIRSLEPQGDNTVFARIVVEAKDEALQPLEFGYSDRVRVYCNGRLLYQGDNTYRSRDYRYLGTIGLFDRVYLPLRKGPNTVLIAVSEAFGGWGLVGRFPESTDLTVIK